MLHTRQSSLHTVDPALTQVVLALEDPLEVGSRVLLLLEVLVVLLPLARLTLDNTRLSNLPMVDTSNTRVRGAMVVDIR